MSDDETPPKKERVLHTRVPAVLDQELKRLAKNLRVPVSNVVRAILEDAVDAVDTVGERAEGGLLGFVDRLQRQRGDLRSKVAPDGSSCPAEAPELEGVVGYQPLVLASDADCGVCGRRLEAGKEALRALFDEPGERVFVAPTCRHLPRPEQ